MTIGPLERFAQRLEQLEARLGRRPGVVVRKARKEGRLGPGGIWIKERLDPRHPEALDKHEQDLVGEMILAYERGDFGEAQKLLDALAYGFRLRMDVERANGATMGTSSSACVDKDDAAKD
jgi:hypothetical protein